MKVLRTPEDRFVDLPDYNFAPNYVTVENGGEDQLRIHYLDEGNKQGVPILLMHGEPSWSYLYRNMIPGLVDAGYRVLAPDLVGFGRSDKPAERSDYTYQRHVDWMSAWLDRVELNNTVLFCQDWGGLIGLRLVVKHAERFAGVVAANTFLPTGDVEPGDAFMKWQHYSQSVEEFPVGGILQGASETTLSPEEVSAYDAPFPDETYKAGARQFPILVPTTPDDPASEANREAWQVLMNLKMPFLTAFSDKDPVSAGGDIVFQKKVTGAQHQKHVTMTGGGHFLQEDNSGELVDVITSFIQENGLEG